MDILKMVNNSNKKALRIASFGFRSLPPSEGSAGADKFALELLPRLTKLGHSVVAYNRYTGYPVNKISDYNGVKIKSFSTVKKKGFDTLLHSLKCTIDIIVHNTADIIHIHNGGNSIWAPILRLFGKKVFISQDGFDWKREKWPWYGKAYLRLTSVISAKFSNMVIFDNEEAKKYFEAKFNKSYVYIPYGSEVPEVKDEGDVLNKFSLARGNYYLFVGRFIPDKGLHYLLPAFKASDSSKKLVLVGGSPNPSEYEKELKEFASEKIIFTGFVYGDDVTRLMRNCYCYIQPSDVEGLSPVVLTVMGLGVPLIVSDIEENVYAVQDTALKFKKGQINSLKETINYAESHYPEICTLAQKAKERALTNFNWDKVAEEHVRIFSASSV